MMEKVVKLKNIEEAKLLFGKHDENLKRVKNELSVDVVWQDEDLRVTGAQKGVEAAAGLFEELLEGARKGEFITGDYIASSLQAIQDGRPLKDEEKIDVFSNRQFVVPRTAGQRAYIEAIKGYDFTFGIGPAGTGKTYLAMAMAVSALKSRQVSRIILTRPAVEAGEKLGFLPGDLYAKITPYLRPLYDALYDMLEPDRIERFTERGIIEVAPLAYMRGRTLNDAFIIMDEAQNSTPEQMKMFLTRIGFNSKTVITGDITQSDLPEGKISGLIQVESLLKEIKGIKFVYFSGKDVVRHKIVQEIIRAYAGHVEK